MEFRRIPYIVPALLVLFALSACVTQKSRDEEYSLIGKLYHNTTAHYNGYFNADELMTESLIELRQQAPVNYQQLLPVYPALAAPNPQAINKNMDLAIEKVTRVVNLHRQSQWTDDCYLMLGKANYYKRDYESAEAAFRYLVNEFDPMEIAEEEAEEEAKGGKNKKKLSKKERAKIARKKRREYNRRLKRKKRGKDVKLKSPEDRAEEKKEELAEAKAEAEEEEKIEPYDDSYFMKHRPVYQEGVLWLARTLIERDNFDGAFRMINQLQTDEYTFKDIKPRLDVLLGYYYISQEKYADAIVPLESAMNTAKEREDQARYAFIVAQIYERKNMGSKAYYAYERVLDFRPDYEMAFTCRLNMAQNRYRAGEGSADDAIANLEKLLKDEKNLEYKDRIYLAMAQVELDRNRRAQAIEYLKLALRSSVQDKQQQANAYYTLANLSFQSEQFVAASAYYDSTLMVMNEQDPRLEEVKRLSDNLTEIARNLQIIERQDSLLRLSGLSEEEKRALAYNLLKKQQEEQRAQAIQAKNNAGSSNTATRRDINVTRPGTPALQKESSFFAYDDRAIKRGKREFQQRWGNRPLADNWRRATSNRQEEDEEVADTDAILQVDAAAEALTDEQIDQLLADIPGNDGEIKKAEQTIAKALFDLGVLYRDRLSNNEKSIDALEELNRRFPRSNFELDSWYYLYLAHSDEGNLAKAQEYKEKILNRYGSTVYAKVLKNPNYADEVANRERQINPYYDQAYTAFQNGQYQRAYNMSSDAKTKYGAENPLQPRFALLTAMSLGSLQGKEAYVKALNEVIAKYPNTEVQTQAREILRLLGEKGGRSLPGQSEDEAAAGNYKLDDNQVHFIIIAFNGDVNLNEAEVAVSDFNQKFFKSERLNISNVFLGNSAADRVPLLNVRRFRNRSKAMQYYETVEKNTQEFLNDPDYSYEMYAISLNNYREILRSKSLSAYGNFFKNNYLQ